VRLNPDRVVVRDPHLGIALLKERGVDVVKADLVVQPGRYQSQEEGQQVDKDGHAP
jgi:hypothetical protein